MKSQWQTLPPERQRRLQKGSVRWQAMTPDQRQLAK
ncbi:MAG TPA: DUF3106 domain-containing protein [Gammaproteobacteria bacterium]|nr:DUF3106 domain-containing protein [Gammaproteobacteria bacterium]HIL97941.1 DUF3106 domain-containing protein [Pseudomonadales bacterium]